MLLQHSSSMMPPMLHSSSMSTSAASASMCSSSTGARSARCDPEAKVMTETCEVFPVQGLGQDVCHVLARVDTGNG